MKLVFISIHLLLSMIAIMLQGCCASKAAVDEIKLTVQFTDVYCWLNLMPGGPGSFHITGEYSVKNNEPTDFSDVTISRIKVIQGGNELYSFRPAGEFESITLNSNEERTNKFFVRDHLKINPDLDSERNIDVLFEFTADGKVFCVTEENIRIEKAY